MDGGFIWPQPGMAEWNQLHNACRQIGLIYLVCATLRIIQMYADMGVQQLNEGVAVR